MSINELVDLYMKYGRSKGFCEAEFLLMDYLPKDNLLGRCCDVPENKRVAFANRMKHGLLEANNVTVD